VLRTLFTLDSMDRGCGLHIVPVQHGARRPRHPVENSMVSSGGLGGSAHS
jgi:hypothetical protein